ncbi:PcfJ domain-containing protein [Hymenobacter edaphi]|uniref:PcfJ-like protein n=1 Tax=Hymenobacter edaphi TaxID=2211146 RepID=A0A328BVJ7_9BACT|nr:PcfJ domain-containing protein [Hymenobacter edaphi]RAK70541.1 hypothetical protein DLM85_06820 [Hymenobacter edaphi]
MANRLKPLSYEAQRAQQAVAALTQARRTDWRKWAPSRQIDYLFSLTGEPRHCYNLLGEETPLAKLYEGCVYGQNGAERQRRQQVLLALAAKRTELLQRPEVSAAVAALTHYYPLRRRELADWQPRSRNVYRQLESLVRHLFDEYGDVPGWLLNSWTAGRLQDGGVNIAELTLHLGSGHALRRFQGLPVPLTKKLEHHLRLAPAGCTFLEALRYAQLAARDALAWFGAVLESRMGREIGPDDAFWLTVVDFFVAAPMVDPRHFGPVCDWIHEKRSVGIGDEPAQPGFSLKGRSMVSVLAQTEQWHRQLAQVRRYAPGPVIPLTTTWTPMPVPNFTNNSKKNPVLITQLLTYGALLEEGRELHHCVASYLSSCRQGRCAIFGLTQAGLRAVTLEVAAGGVIVQARGKHNRPMDASERLWVQRWATDARLTISKHV